MCDVACRKSGVFRQPSAIKAQCCARVPVGMNTPAFLPHKSATSVSKALSADPELGQAPQAMVMPDGEVVMLSPENPYNNVNMQALQQQQPVPNANAQETQQSRHDSGGVQGVQGP